MLPPRKRMYLAFVPGMGIWALSVRPAQPPFCASIASIGSKQHNPVDDALATSWMAWNTKMQANAAPNLRAKLECPAATPAPTPLMLVTFSPTPNPTPPPTPAPTPPVPESLCPAVELHGASLAHWVPKWCLGPFSMDSKLVELPRFGGLPVYTRRAAEGQTCNIYYSISSQMWVLGAAVGRPPFFIFAKVSEPAVEWAPWRIEGSWQAFSRKTKTFVKLPDALVKCAAKTSSPTSAPTPVPTPAPTPTPRVTHSRWCKRLLLSFPSATLRNYAGLYVLVKGHKGRPVYQRKITVSEDRTVLHLYFDPAYRQWVVSVRMFDPPFYLLAKSAAPVPERIPADSWQHYNGMTYKPLHGAVATCPAITPMPTPRCAQDLTQKRSEKPQKL